MSITKPAECPGEIRPEVLYRLDEIKRRSGLGAWAFRQARRNGLNVLYLGGRAFVFGQDFIDYVRRVGQQQPTAR